MNLSGPSAFQSGGGAMGAKVRAFDWAGTPLGPIAGWSVALRVSVDQMLASKFPACLFWGPELIAIYNDGYHTILGAKPQALGRPMRETWEEVWPQLQPIAEKALAGESTFIEDYVIHIDRNGRLEDAAFTFNYGPVFDEHGQVVAMLDTVVETTSKLQAEAELRQLNATLEQRVVERTLARGRAWQVSPEMLCVLDARGCFEAANPAWEKALGWNEAEMARTPFQRLVHPDDMDHTLAAWTQASVRGQPVLRLENRYRSRAGDWHWLSWVAVPEDGKVYCIARDVTEQKEHAAALAQRTAERDWLATLVQTSDTFMQVLDLDYRFLAINQANSDEYLRAFGLRPALGDRLPDLLQDMPAERDAALALWSRAMAGESFSVQHAFGAPGHARSHYEMKLEVLRGPDGRQIGAFMTSTDITARLQAEQALAETQEALRQAQKMEAVGQLTGGIAHDFNNLLASISGALQVMRMRLEQGRSDDLPAYLDMGERSVRRAASLTQRLLAFSRRQTLDPKPTDVNRLVQGMAELIARTVGPAVQLLVDAEPAPWPTRVDAPQLENALLNLCINARDAMPEGGRLVLATCRRTLAPTDAAAHGLPAGDYMCLRVTDTGTGMPQSVVQRVFDPFFTTKPLGQGTGLGLSMVYGFVRQSGGQIQVESAPGHGTTMRLLLPRHLGDAALDEADGPLSPPDGGVGETVLLIEDEDIVRELLAEVLGDAGYTVLSAADGPAGLRELQAPGPIDLLLTDVGLPGGMNGRQVADAGRALRPALQVLFITGYAEAAMVGNGFMEAGMAVMTKPFDLASLVGRVREMLDSRATAAP
ncbi:PAS domain-containing protein [Pseudorhodoferax sp.]|uniref:PAS domain-containing protein n=1 Tax=Pseudorhodoferax sp. TaxID=1993553 RepID=UPI002DD67AE8|nr:PAS domain-containing protein [Pseudorhodoferax sp.]